MHVHRGRAGFPAANPWLTADLLTPGYARGELARLAARPCWTGRDKVEFRVLGPLEVTAGGQSLQVGGARTRAVLAMLLVHVNQVVSADRLAEELWPDHPAARAAANLQVRLSELRKALRSAGEADRLVTRPPGYLLRAAPDVYKRQPGSLS